MFKKKCSSCGKKIERKFSFCPWCGNPTKLVKQEDYGMLGVDDEIAPQNFQRPSLLNNLLESTIKQLSNQLSKEFGDVGLNEGMPKNFQIRVSTGVPSQKIIRNPTEVKMEEEIDEKEKQRRTKLPRVNAESKLRRLPEGIIYEINTPGVKSKKDVIITKLEDSIEIRAYSKDKCYIKTIPIKVEVLRYVVKEDKVFVQIKN